MNKKLINADPDSDPTTFTEKEDDPSWDGASLENGQGSWLKKFNGQGPISK
jgi:hypothetical protein